MQSMVRIIECFSDNPNSFYLFHGASAIDLTNRYHRYGINTVCNNAVRQKERIPGKTGDPSGAGNVTRTHDLLITNQLLYRLSYTSE